SLSAVSTGVALVGVRAAAAIPFCGLGLLLGCVASPNASPAVANLVCLPMSFCSGLWIPLPFLPSAVQHAARFLPAYHLGQLALGVAGAPTSGGGGGGRGGGPPALGVCFFVAVGGGGLAPRAGVFGLWTAAGRRARG